MVRLARRSAVDDVERRDRIAACIASCAATETARSPRDQAARSRARQRRLRRPSAARVRQVAPQLRAGGADEAARAGERAGAQARAPSRRSRSYGPGMPQLAGLRRPRSRSGRNRARRRPAARPSWPSRRASRSARAHQLARRCRGRCAFAGDRERAEQQRRRGPGRRRRSTAARCRPRGRRSTATSDRPSAGSRPSRRRSDGLGEARVAEGRVEQRFARGDVGRASRGGS